MLFGGLCAAGALAQAADPATDEAQRTSIECSADGYEVLLTNSTPDGIEVGQSIKWNVPFVRKSGVHGLDKTLEPGESLFISGALGSDYLSSPQPCTASVQ